MSQQTNVADLLKNIDMDALVRIMKPSATPDGARQLILPVYNTQVSLKAFPGSKHLTDAQLDEALIAALQDAFINIGNTDEGKAVIAIYSHNGYQKAVSADYDNERAAQKLIQELSAAK